MSENQKLDLAQRIAAALGHTDDPRQMFENEPEEGATLLGVVPLHLRHLHNLVNELGQELRDAEDPMLEQQRNKEFHFVRALFFASLETYVPTPEGCEGIMLVNDWKVYTMNPRPRNKLEDMLEGLLGGRVRVFVAG